MRKKGFYAAVLDKSERDGHKNVLFFTSCEVSPEKGGTERITASVAEILRRDYGWRCYSLYSSPIDPEYRRVPFDASLRIASLRRKKDRMVLRRFIEERKIDVIVNQGDFRLCRQLKEITEGLPNVKIVLCHHFQPGWEEHFLRLKKTMHKPKDFVDLLRVCWRIAKFPYQKITNVSRNRAQYHVGYNYADRTILLSARFIPEFMAYAGIKDGSKLDVIHNMLSFDAFFEMTEYEVRKRKEVLIVSRFDEPQKRLSLAIRIWALIESDHKFDDWRLRIVGHGIDEQIYRSLAKDLNLQRLSFEGAQKSQPYYESASLFLMTSKSEGWGLTLTEAQQMACVPLAFDTYASLHDIIADGYNGYIITDGDLDGYAVKMKQLMIDDDLRMRMASRAIESSHRFEKQIIGCRWHDLLSDVSV